MNREPPLLLSPGFLLNVTFILSESDLT